MDTRKNLLVEIGTEEIPAGFLPPALDAFAARTGEVLREKRIGFEAIKTLATPRRLVLWVEGVEIRQEDLLEKVMGPPKKVAFDDQGNPTKAAHGFAKRNGVSVEDLEIEETERGPYVCIKKRLQGRPTRDILNEVLPTLVSEIPFPKNMKWEASGFRFARPIRWLLGIFGDEVLDFEIAGIACGNKTFGHRFHAPGSLEPGSGLKDYIEALRGAYVVVDQDERREAILSQARSLSEGAGGRLLEDEALLELNTFLVEYPYCVLGDFDKAFLSLPEEVLITVMKEHQKYFAVVDQDGRLMPHFIAVNNIEPRDETLLRRGHERVLRARLNDARFFFDEDLKRPLEAYCEELKGVIFHKDLGSLYDKVERIVKIAAYLADLVAPDQKSSIERAAYLSKADLVTEMVGEFPDLQGVMGRVYGELSGEPKNVANAIYEHYLPTRSGGEIPKSIEGAIVGISDRCDTICSTFALGMRPTGGQDPFGLRRHALAIIHILEGFGLHIDLEDLIQKGLQVLVEGTGLTIDEGELTQEILEFFKVRLKNELVQRGIRPDTAEAALRAHFDDPVDAVMRAKAIEAVRHRPEFEPLSIAFKRCMNILKGQEITSFDPALLREDAERGLFDALEKASTRVEPLFRERKYEDAMIVLLELKPSVDTFFDEVLVMAEDSRLRANRLALVARIVELFLRVGDLSAISS